VCIACGMPMESKADHPSGNMALDYCAYCARRDGSMQSYNEKLINYSSWLVRSQGLKQKAAIDHAQKILNELPAWKKSHGSH